MVSKSAVIGIDLGTAESFVAYVGKGIVDCVQNEVSKRATSSLVGFTPRERLLGDAAYAQVKSNAKNSCRNFKHLLGQKVDAAHVEKEHFWSTCPLETAADGYCGYNVTYKGENKVYSAPEVTAMFITKLKEITESWCQAKVADAVIAVPSYFSDVHRQAVLDAAKIANLPILRLMNEHTATALAYGIYRSNDFDPEKPCTVAFCSMGHSTFSVSFVQFVKGKLTVICEACDKVGGRDMDECLMRVFSEQFKKKFGCEPISNKKACLKLEDAVAKTKKILSANYEAGVNCECLMEDEDFSSNMTRTDFEAMCQPMMDKVQAVLDKAKALAGPVAEQVDFIEVVGGSSRVPWMKNMCSAAFGGKELSTTMNADESVARGCALQAAILSPLYKVRDFKVEDCSPYAYSVGWMGSAADAEAKEEGKEEDGDVKMTGGEGEPKTAVLFPVNSQMNVTKKLTFFRKGPFDVKAEYVDDSVLIPGTAKELGNYRVELAPQDKAKKVVVKAQLTLNGMFKVESAQLLEDEEYEETVKEKREIPAAEAEAAAPAAEAAPESPKPEGDVDMSADASPKPEGEAASPKSPAAEGEKKPEVKKPTYEWIEVKKMKKRTKQTDLKITATGKPGIPADKVQLSMDHESAIQADMKEIIDTDAKRNDLEGYIFDMRDKISSSGKYGAYITDADRDKFNSELTTAEDWTYDEPDATKVQLIEKLDALKAVGDPVAWRCNEDSLRGEWVTAVQGTVTNYRAVAENPGENYSHIAPEKLLTIKQSCDELETWLQDLQAKQAPLGKTDKPVLLCAEMEKKNAELSKSADKILKEPKPAPPKEEKVPEKKEGEETAENKENKENEAKDNVNIDEAGDAQKPDAPAEAPQNMDVDVD